MNARYRFGPFTFDPTDGELRAPQGTQRLQPLVAALLTRFVTEPNRLFAHEELMALLWPDAFVNGEALTQVLSRLRRALGETRTEARWIETLHKRGYRFIGEVTRVDGADARPRDVTAQTTLRGEATARRFIALSIAAHRDRARIGEVARLPLLELGERARISRLEPAFSRLRGDPAAPLGDPHLSREPLELRREGAELVLVTPPQVDLWIDGVSARSETRIAIERATVGVTLELGDHATLVLHACAEPKPPKGPLALVGASAATEVLRAELALAAASELAILVAAATVDEAEPLLRALAQHELPVIAGAESLTAAELAARTSQRVVLLTTLSGAAAAEHPALRDLAAYGLVVTPLGERRADIAPLIAERLATDLAAPLMARLVRHAWPGGLAELRAVVGQLDAAARESLLRELPRYLDERLPRRTPRPV